MGMVSTNHQKTALVLSGGGAYGAYEVGVIKALSRGSSPATEFRRLDPDIYTGTSVGAYNASFLASAWPEACREANQSLENIWVNLIGKKTRKWGNGVYRYRLDPFKFLNPMMVARHPIQTLSNIWEDSIHLTPRLLAKLRSLLSTPYYRDISTEFISLFDLSLFISLRPFEKTLRETLDIHKIRQSPKFLGIVATQWKQGSILLALNHKTDPDLWRKIVKGSSSIPGIFPSEKIQSERLVDGGILLNTPLDPALRAGARQLFVVDLSPNLAEVPSMLSSTIGSMYRAQLTAWEFRLQIALENARIHNMITAQRNSIYKLLAELDLSPHDKHAILEQIKKAWRLVHWYAGKGDKPTTIHIFRPSRYLGTSPLGILNFNRRRIVQLIEHGYRDAVHHDCAREGCILPSQAQADQSLVFLDTIHRIWNSAVH